MKAHVKEALETGQKEYIGRVFAKIESDLQVDLYKKLPLMTLFCSLIVRVTRWTRRTSGSSTSR